MEQRHGVVEQLKLSIFGDRYCKGILKGIGIQKNWIETSIQIANTIQSMKWNFISISLYIQIYSKHFSYRLIDSG